MDSMDIPSTAQAWYSLFPSCIVIRFLRLRLPEALPCELGPGGLHCARERTGDKRNDCSEHALEERQE